MNSGLKAEAIRLLDSIVGLVNEQADDDGLWFQARTAPEAYLQQELRRLHAEIERVILGRVTSTGKVVVDGQ